MGPDDPLPDRHAACNLDEFADRMTERYPDGLVEIGLFRRSGPALAEVLRGQADPLTLLFGSGEPTAADLYLKAPVARAANQMLAEADPGLGSRIAPGKATPGNRGRGGDRISNRVCAAGASGRAVRLHVYGYLGGLLRRGGGAFRRRRRRIPPAGYRAGPGCPGLSTPTATTC